MPWYELNHWYGIQGHNTKYTIMLSVLSALMEWYCPFTPETRPLSVFLGGSALISSVKRSPLYNIPWRSETLLRWPGPASLTGHILFIVDSSRLIFFDNRAIFVFFLTFSIPKWICERKMIVLHRKIRLFESFSVWHPFISVEKYLEISIVFHRIFPFFEYIITFKMR